MKITETLLDYIISNNVKIEICVNRAVIRAKGGNLSKTKDGMFLASNGSDCFYFSNGDVEYIWKNQYGYTIHTKKEEDIDDRFYERNEYE